LSHPSTSLTVARVGGSPEKVARTRADGKVMIWAHAVVPPLSSVPPFSPVPSLSSLESTTEAVADSAPSSTPRSATSISSLQAFGPTDST